MGLRFSTSAQNLDQFEYSGKVEVPEKMIREFRSFNGYTGDWINEYEYRYRYGGLFKKVVPDVMTMVLQNKVDIAEALGMTGLALQEGFLSELLASDYIQLQNPALGELELAINGNNVLIYTSPDSEAGGKLLSLADDVNSWRRKMPSNQFLSSDYSPMDAFMLKSGDQTIFAVISSKIDEIKAFQRHLELVKQIVDKYDFHKGWMGLSTGYRVIGTDFGHPLDYVGEALNEGNSWVVFSGYNDFYMKDDFRKWMDEVGNPTFAPDLAAVREHLADEQRPRAVQRMRRRCRIWQRRQPPRSTQSMDGSPARRAW